MFWPGPQQDLIIEHPAPEVGAVRVKLTSSDNSSLSRTGYHSVELSLHSQQQRTAFAVKMLFCPHWPRNNSNSSDNLPLKGAVDFLQVVRRERGGGGGRVAVVDALGGKHDLFI